MVSCTGPEWEKTSSGLQYRILRNEGGKKFINGHYLYLNMEIHDEKDSLLYSTATRGLPDALQFIDTVWIRRGQIFEGLEKLNVGDSAIFKVNCEDLYLVSLKDPIPEGVDPESDITVYVGVRHMSTPEEFRIWQSSHFAERLEAVKRESEEQRFADMAEIDEYMELYGLVPQEHESGIRYIINREGDGNRPDYGDRVTIRYTVKLPDGTPVDPSHDSRVPVEFTIGKDPVIPGWEIGVKLMKKGASYTFWLPSGLAFGDRNAGTFVKANSILVYTIELLEIQRKEE